MTILFGRTQECLDTPFEPNRNPQWGGNPGPSGLISTEAQSAIEEAYFRALSNDRFLVLAHYGGNANTGRYLEFYPNEDSSISPLFLPVTARILSVNFQTTSATATCTMGFFDLNISSIIPIYSLSLNGKRVTATGNPLGVVGANGLLSARVTSGSINTPTLQLTLSAST